MHRPSLHRWPRFSLKTRLSIGVVAIVFVTTFAIATAALYMAKGTVRASISAEQFGRLSSIGDAIDQKFLSRQTLLKSFGDGIRASRSASPELLQPFLEQHASLRAAFTNVFVVDRAGMLAASLAYPQQVGKLNLTRRPYFIEVMRSGDGVISQPFKNAFDDSPQVVMAQPVLDELGLVQCVVVGTINLKNKNFLGELADVKFGNTGYMFIFNTDGIIVDHPQPARILQPFDSTGKGNPATRHALGGFDGTVEALGSNGVSALYTYKRISQTNWIIGARYPSAEAFESIDRIERTAWLVALGMALLAGSVALAVMHHQLRPLEHLHQHMTVAQTKKSYTRLALRFNEDEIGDIARTFDALMSQRQEFLDRLHDSELFMKNLADNIPVLIAYIDSEQRYRFVNSTFLLWTGAEPTTVMGRKMEDVLGPERYAERLGHLDAALSGTRVDFEIRVVAMNCPPYVQTSYVPDLRPDGSVAGVYCIASDVTFQKQVQRRLDAMARIDSLTGIPNRREFEERLEDALARTRRSRRPMALIYLDIDHFKHINDVRGHAAGDSVLKEFALRLQGSIRITDTPARLGGDEFVVILEGLHRIEEVADIARKIQAAIRRPMNVDSNPLRVTTSIGFAYFEGSGGSVETLMAKADAALYRAKDAGRDTFASITV